LASIVYLVLIAWFIWFKVTIKYATVDWCKITSSCVFPISRWTKCYIPKCRFIIGTFLVWII